jgi:hypothetical protein
VPLTPCDSMVFLGRLLLCGSFHKIRRDGAFRRNNHLHGDVSMDPFEPMSTQWKKAGDDRGFNPLQNIYCLPAPFFGNDLDVGCIGGIPHIGESCPRLSIFSLSVSLCLAHGVSDA